MNRLKAVRSRRVAIAVIVVVAHILMGWLWMLMSVERPIPQDPAASAVPVFATILETPRPEPLGSPAPVKLALVPVTQPKLPTPEFQLIEVETLDSPAPGPDPAPSSSQLVTRPGPANAGGRGYPASLGNRQLKLVRRVRPVYPPASIHNGEAGTVQMRVRVDERGRVAEVRLLQTSGYQRLDDAATRAVGKWKFEPVVQQGRPVTAWTQINLGMSTYQHKYCRIGEEPADDSGEDVHDGPGAAFVLGNETAVNRLINDLASGSPEVPGAFRTLLSDWGPVLSIRYSGDTGYQGYVTRDILPAYQSGHAGNAVQVRWDMYLVKHERLLTRWRVATDRSGEIWCVHVGPGPRIG